MSRAFIHAILFTPLLAACDTASGGPGMPAGPADGSTETSEGEAATSAAADAASDSSANDTPEFDGAAAQLPVHDAGDASASAECAQCDAGVPPAMPAGNPPSCRPFNVLSDPSFEDGPSTFGPPWKKVGAVNLDSASGTSFRGNRHARIQAVSSWSAITQRVVVRPGTDYVLSSAIQTSSVDFGLGRMGLRTLSGEILQELSFPAQSAYRELSLQLNVRRNTVVELYVGTQAPAASTWMRVDAVSLSPVGMCDAPRVCANATSCQAR